MMSNVNKSIDVIIKSNDKILAGQQNAILSQQAAINDVTNRIILDWEESLAGVRSWQVNCGGLYVMNQVSLNELEQAFIDGTPVSASLTIDETLYEGECLITTFPLQATFNKGLTYSLVLIGTGPLSRVEL